MSHTGPVIVRLNTDQQRYLVLCPLGHLVTGGRTDATSGFAGSFAQARITAHQQGSQQWTVTCDGAV